MFWVNLNQPYTLIRFCRNLISPRPVHFLTYKRANIPWFMPKQNFIWPYAFHLSKRLHICKISMVLVVWYMQRTQPNTYKILCFIVLAFTWCYNRSQYWSQVDNSIYAISYCFSKSRWSHEKKKREYQVNSYAHNICWNCTPFLLCKHCYAHTSFHNCYSKFQSYRKAASAVIVHLLCKVIWQLNFLHKRYI